MEYRCESVQGVLWECKCEIHLQRRSSANISRKWHTKREST